MWTVEPVAVLGVQPYWYLWRCCRLRGAPRGFPVDRIRSAKGLDTADVELRYLIDRGILGNLNAPATNR